MDSIRLITDAERITRLYINGTDIGVLYLGEGDYKILGDVLSSGGNELGVEVDAPQPPEADIDIDIFDEYD
jgi:hypothetical protein